MAMATAEPRWRRVWRAAGWLLAAGLLVAAVTVAVRGVDWTVVRAASPWQLAALAAAVVANLLLTAALFWVVTRSFDARPGVSLGRMSALIAVSHLLNYLPLVRAGLFGRAAYLKARHALPLRQSALILAIILALAVVVLGSAALVLRALPEGWRWAVALGVLVVLSGITAPLSRLLLRRPLTWAWSWAPLRAADMLVNALRLWLAFAVMGVSIGFADAVVIGAAGLMVRLVGLTPNGLGLSEWVVAGLSTALAISQTAVGAAAALLDRAVEIAVTSVTGVIAAWWLRH